MFHLKNDSFLSKAKEGVPSGGGSKISKPAIVFKMSYKKTSNLIASGPAKTRLLLAVQ